MIGQSKLRLINTYIIDQPWFVELDDKEKLAYVYMHLKCSDIGVYLHSEKAMSNHLGFSFSVDEILEWLNQKRKMGIKLNPDTILLQWMIKEHSKRGSKIKPVSNPDLGKVREAIDSGVINILIENDTFHIECKLFEFGITESLIENKSYSTKVKKGEKYSSYEVMIERLKTLIQEREGLGKQYKRFIEGLDKPLTTVLTLNQKISPTSKKSHSKDLNQQQSYSIYSKIAEELKFECADFLREKEVFDHLEALVKYVPNIEEWVRDVYYEFDSECGRNRRWVEFVDYLDEKLPAVDAK